MKRKLISYDVFESIQNNSLSNAEHELLEVEPILSKTLETEGLSLVCYGPESVVYESTNGGYIHANYRITESYIEFDNIEELVIDEETEVAHSKDVLNQMLEAILDGNDAKANEMFDLYISQGFFKRNISEGFEISASATTGHGRKSAFRGRTRAGGKAAAMKAARTRKLHARSISPAMKTRMDALRKKEADKLGGKHSTTGKGQRHVRTTLRFKSPSSKRKNMKEWNELVENVFNYVEYKEFGPILRENVLAHDDKGNVTAIRVPNIKLRNEAKLLSFNWDTMDTDVKVLRGGAKQLAENQEFCKAIANLKRSNALSDTEKLQESLEDVVSRWSNLLYLTQTELATVVAEALHAVGATNYDDQTCEFIAEALLVTAHDSYVDRVSKIMGLAGTKVDEATEDAYAAFKQTVDNFYPTLDETAAHEMQVYVDLYESLRSIYDMSEDNEFLRAETTNHLNELAAIIEQAVQPSLDVAIAAAEWLSHLVETNLDSEKWDVSNTVHTTVSGDHPRMAQNAQQGYTPSSDFSGNWGDSAPVSDGSSYRNKLSGEMRSNSWGNIGGEGVYPSLDNPYIPKPFGDYKIKGEKNIDGDSDQLAHWGSQDTWPAMQNPYVPKGVTPQSYKMKETDLVVDK